ncbi:C3 and PZP-like, alpha-2-macroglobulin domain containing 8 [Chamberlinius hualienensis]
MKFNLAATLLLFVIADVNLQQPQDKGYVFTAPSVFDSGSTENICLSLFGVQGQGTITVVIDDFDGHKESAVGYFINKKSKCFKLKVPAITRETATLQINGNFDWNYQFKDSKIVKIRQRADLILIQTDKSVYKVTHKVQFRIFHVSPEFLQSSNKIQSVIIEDPEKAKVFEKNNPTAQSGIYDLNYDLSDRPRLGNWTIKVVDDKNNRREKTFIVQEYELPSFAVKLNPPNVISPNFKIIKYQVCADYTFEESVRGKLKTNVTFISIDPNVPQAMVQREHVIDGCADIIIGPNEFNFGGRNLQQYDFVNFYAVVTEDGTGSTMNSIVVKHLKIAHIFQFLSKPYFKHGLPYNGKIYVQDKHGIPLADETFTIHAIEHRQRTAIKTYQFNLKTDKEGFASFTVPAQNTQNQFLKLKITANNFKNNIYHYLGFRKSNAVPMKPTMIENLKPWRSSCNCLITVKGPIELPMKCKFKTHLTIEMTQSCYVPNSFDVYYQVMAKNDIFNQFQETIDKNKLSKVGKLLSFKLPITIDPKMSPKIEVLVYFKSGKEIVSDSETFPIERCYDNKVEMKFDKKKVPPGGKAILDVTAVSNSMCSTFVTDKSVQLLSGSEFNPYMVFNMINDIPPNFNNLIKDSQCTRRDPQLGKFQRNPHILQSRAAFDDAGLITMTDLQLDLNPCTPTAQITYAKPFLAGYGDEDDNDNDNDNDIYKDDDLRRSKPEVDVRHFFPETWIWELFPMNGNNKVSLARNIPHSITKWVGNTFCISPTKGLGISPPASIISYQHVSLSISMPQTIVQGETAPITVDIKSFFPDCFPAVITLQDSLHFDMVSKFRQVQQCICGKQSNIYKYHIHATKAGEINVLVNINSVPPGNHQICAAGAHDIWAYDNINVTRSIKVPAIPRETSTSNWICATGAAKTQKIKLNVPADASPGTPRRAKALVTGDIMGPTITNMDHLVLLPNWCSEQTMSTFAPLVFLVSYLQATNQLTNDFRNKAVKYITQGYMNELKYQIHDGSFNTWGDRNQPGSVWLTAYVIKTLAIVRSKLPNLVAIDQNIIQRGFNYLISKQQNDGCFHLNQHSVENYALRGRLVAGDATVVGITTYVTMSLLESSNPSQDVITKAFQCINRDGNPTRFRKTLKAYALALAGKTAEANALITTLQTESTTNGDMTYWEAGGTRELNVEATAYVLLAIATLRTGHHELGLRIFRWLVNQRNAQGSYASTQATVIGNQALELFMSRIALKTAEMSVKIKNENRVAVVTVHGNNRLATKNIEITGNEIDVETSGTGCVLIQFTLTYYTGGTHVAKTFYIDVSVKKDTNPAAQIIKKTLHICTRYQGTEPQSSMAIIDIQLPSGYMAENQFEKLSQMNINVGNWQFEDGKVILYFNSIKKTLTCFDIVITEKMQVPDRKPAIIKVYDYYAPEFESSLEYSV